MYHHCILVGSQKCKNLKHYFIHLNIFVEATMTIAEISKVIGALLLTKTDIRELLNVPELLTQN